MFFETLFTITKVWKQPQCPSIDEQIKKMCDTYTMKYLFSYKKEWDLAICDNIDRPRIMLSEIMQRKAYTI